MNSLIIFVRIIFMLSQNFFVNNQLNFKFLLIFNEFFLFFMLTFIRLRQFLSPILNVMNRGLYLFMFFDITLILIVFLLVCIDNCRVSFSLFLKDF